MWWEVTAAGSVNALIDALNAMESFIPLSGVICGMILASIVRSWRCCFNKCIVRTRYAVLRTEDVGCIILYYIGTNPTTTSRYSLSV